LSAWKIGVVQERPINLGDVAGLPVVEVKKADHSRSK
jgi:hypothetical protein